MEVTAKELLRFHREKFLHPWAFMPLTYTEATREAAVAAILAATGTRTMAEAIRRLDGGTVRQALALYDRAIALAGGPPDEEDRTFVAGARDLIAEGRAVEADGLVVVTS